MHKAQRLINHVALVLDGSSSMSKHRNNLVRVADEQIRHLALRSEELSQETRVSVYLFADAVECLIFDMDVMRLPSISDLYKAYGMTALVDSVIKSQNDLSTTSQLYGDHAFLSFVLTDGMENASRHRVSELTSYLNRPEENWTIGFLVPDNAGVAYMERVGASKGSIAIWDKDSVKGLTDAVSTIRDATDNFMTARATGVRGTKNVFSTGPAAVNKKTVNANLAPLADNDYAIYPVSETGQIRDFVQGLGYTYKKGIAYYELMKAETIQPSKQIIVVERRTGKAYSGPNARHLIGLPDGESVRVHPEKNPKYQIFVQSTSVNRKLIPNTKLLVH